MCGFVINILKYEKEGKKKEKKKETNFSHSTAKYKTPNCHFCLWLVDYGILANHRPGSWKAWKY